MWEGGERRGVQTHWPQPAMPRGFGLHFLQGGHVAVSLAGTEKPCSLI